MKRNKDNSEQLFRVCNNKEISHHQLYLTDSKICKGMRTLYIEKREGFRYTQIGNCWHREAKGRLTKNQASYVSGLGNIFGFLWLIFSWKQGQI